MDRLTDRWKKLTKANNYCLPSKRKIVAKPPSPPPLPVSHPAVVEDRKSPRDDQHPGVTTAGVPTPDDRVLMPCFQPLDKKTLSNSRPALNTPPTP